jgi:PIN domain nuclease of toxin-antitoxin system
LKVLLDTHVLVWWLTDARQLVAEARSVIGSPTNVVFVSAVSVWELRIKETLGKVRLPLNFAAVLERQPFEQLSVTVTHAHALAQLPMHHRDPFDRMLIAQARSDGLTLLSHDQVVGEYEVEHLLV